MVLAINNHVYVEQDVEPLLKDPTLIQGNVVEVSYP